MNQGEAPTDIHKITLKTKRYHTNCRNRGLPSCRVGTDQIHRDHITFHIIDYRHHVSYYVGVD